MPPFELVFQVVEVIANRKVRVVDTFTDSVSADRLARDGNELVTQQRALPKAHPHYGLSLCYRVEPRDLVQMSRLQHALVATPLASQQPEAIQILHQRILAECVTAAWTQDISPLDFYKEALIGAGFCADDLCDLACYPLLTGERIARRIRAGGSS